MPKKPQRIELSNFSQMRTKHYEPSPKEIPAPAPSQGHGWLGQQAERGTHGPTSWGRILARDQQVRPGLAVITAFATGHRAHAMLCDKYF